MSKYPFTWWFAINSFRVLEGKESKITNTKDIESYMTSSHTYVETSLFITEKQILANFSKVFGISCPFFGKILYLYMSKGFDRAKISFLRYLECLYPFMND